MDVGIFCYDCDMAKSSSVFICQNCNASFPKWAGQCASCGEWNTLVETMGEQSGGAGGGFGGGVGARTKGTRNKKFDPNIIVPFSEVGSLDVPHQRISTGMFEFDRVLGDDKAGKGMVPGAVMLIGGEPGIGKSTLLTQISDTLGPVLYVCGHHDLYHEQ